MKRLSFRVGRTTSSVSQSTTSTWKWSPVKAWALGLGGLGGVALLAINSGSQDSDFSRASTDEQAVALTEGDGALAHAFYSAGLTQELGTFGAFSGAGTAKTSPDGAAGEVFSSAQATGGTLLYTGGGARAVDALYSAYGLGGIGSARQFAGGGSAAFGSSRQGFRSAGGSGGGGAGGGNSGHASGGSAGGAGGAASAAAANSSDALAASKTSEGPSVSSSGGDEGEKAAALAFPADGAPQSFPFAEEAALAAEGRVEVAETLLAKGIDEAGESLALVKAAVLDDENARVPDLASTWALLAVAFTGLTVLRRLPA